LKAIREALGMTTRQYSARLGVSQPRVVLLEKGEAEGTLTLESLRRAAEALDCELVYVLVPRKPLTQMLLDQAELKTEEQLGRMDQTMQLENQALTAADRARQRALLVDELLRGDLRRLWDQPA
jgi:predicted DNA-binding mobile mystery protein A